MRSLKKRLSDLLKYCHELMYHPKDRVNEEAFITICDLLIVFSKNMASNEVMKPLVYEPDKNLQQQLSNFLSDKVFVDDEDGRHDNCCSFRNYWEFSIKGQSAVLSQTCHSKISLYQF